MPWTLPLSEGAKIWLLDRRRKLGTLPRWYLETNREIVCGLSRPSSQLDSYFSTAGEKFSSSGNSFLHPLWSLFPCCLLLGCDARLHSIPHLRLAGRKKEAQRPEEPNSFARTPSSSPLVPSEQTQDARPNPLRAHAVKIGLTHDELSTAYHFFFQTIHFPNYRRKKIHAGADSIAFPKTRSSMSCSSGSRESMIEIIISISASRSS